MKKLSAHLSYEELTYSEIAKRYGLNNTPNEEQLKNFKYWAEKVFEPLREKVQTPIHCSSLFRSKEVNNLIPGHSDTSAHLGLNGMAAGDLDNDGFPKWADNRRIFDEAITLPTFDQIIWEFGSDEKPDWVHIGINRFGQNRRQILRSVREDGKVKYIEMFIDRSK